MSFIYAILVIQQSTSSVYPDDGCSSF